MRPQLAYHLAVMIIPHPYLLALDFVSLDLIA